MIKFAWIENDRVTGVVVPSVDDMYTDGETYHGQLARAVDYTIPNIDILKMRYYNNELISIPDAPNDTDYIYDYSTSAWNVISLSTYPLEFADIQDTKIKHLDGNLYDFIVTQSNFVEWKQAEYADNYSELSIKKLTNGVSVDEQTKIDNIVLVRAWKNQLKLDNDTVTTAIGNATTMTEINIAISSMNYIEPPFQL